MNDAKQPTLFLLSYGKKLLVEQKMLETINIFCKLFLMKRLRYLNKNGLSDSSFILQKTVSIDSYRSFLTQTLILLSRILLSIYLIVKKIFLFFNLVSLPQKPTHAARKRQSLSKRMLLNRVYIQEVNQDSPREATAWGLQLITEHVWQGNYYSSPNGYSSL